MTAPAHEVVRGRMVRVAEEDARPLPTLEEFAAFLFNRANSDAPEAAHAQRRLLIEYAGIWAAFEGESRAKAIQQAHEFADEAHMTGAERLQEEQR